MLVTNINKAVGAALWSKRMSREDMSRVMGVQPSSLSRMLHNDMLTRQLIDGLDAVGFDVEFVLVPKGEPSERGE